MPIADDYWSEKVFVQVIDVFNHPIFQRGTDSDVIEEREMLHIFAESHASRVWANRYAKFLGQ